MDSGLYSPIKFNTTTPPNLANPGKITWFQQPKVKIIVIPVLLHFRRRQHRWSPFPSSPPLCESLKLALTWLQLLLIDFTASSRYIFALQ